MLENIGMTSKGALLLSKLLLTNLKPPLKLASLSVAHNVIDDEGGSALFEAALTSPCVTLFSLNLTRNMFGKDLKAKIREQRQNTCRLKLNKLVTVELGF
jgi:hypothetical protein